MTLLTNYPEGSLKSFRSCNCTYTNCCDYVSSVWESSGSLEPFNGGWGIFLSDCYGDVSKHFQWRINELNQSQSLRDSWLLWWWVDLKVVTKLRSFGWPSLSPRPARLRFGVSSMTPTRPASLDSMHLHWISVLIRFVKLPNNQDYFQNKIFLTKERKKERKREDRSMQPWHLWIYWLKKLT